MGRGRTTGICLELARQLCSKPVRRSRQIPGSGAEARKPSGRTSLSRLAASILWLDSAPHRRTEEPEFPRECPLKPPLSCRTTSLRLLWRATAGLIASLLVAAGQLSAQTATATSRETTAASVASYALSADMPVDPEVLVGGAAQRPPLLHPAEPEARAPGRTPAGRQGRVGPGRRRPARPGALCRAHAVPGLEAFPGTEHDRLPVVPRPGHRRGRERRDEFRRHAVHAARARPIVRASSTRALTVLEDWAGGALFEPAGHRAPAADRPRRMAPQPRRQRTDRREVAPRAAGGIALRGPSPDWDPVGDRDRAARAAGAVLSRLVPAGSDGRDRRRRRGQERRRRDDPAALLVARQSGTGAAAADLRRAGASWHPLRHRHRPGEHEHHRESQQPAAGPESRIGRRLSRHHEGSAVRADARRSPRRTRAGRQAAVPAGRRRPWPLPAPRTRDEATLRALVPTTASRAASTRS